MKVVHVTTKYFPNQGGVETVAKQLCECLVSKGVDTRVYTLDLGCTMPKEEEINGVLVKRHRYLIGDPLFLPSPSFLRELHRERGAILHIHNIQTLLPVFVSLTKTIEQKIILQPHYHRYGQTATRHILLSLYKKVIPTLIFNRSSIIIANSEYETQTLKKDFPLKTSIAVIPEGLPLRQLARFPRNPAFPERILYVGALKKYKKVDLVIRAFKKISEIEKNLFKLIIVGEGPYKDRLKKLAAELGISELIEWKSNLERQALLLEYSKAKVFVLLSTLETFSIAVHEAIALGVPTVVSAQGVFFPLVEKGFVEGVNSENPTDIAKAILKARTRKPISYKKLFQDVEIYCEHILKLYDFLDQ